MHHLKELKTILINNNYLLMSKPVLIVYLKGIPPNEIIEYISMKFKEDYYVLFLESENERVELLSKSRHSKKIKVKLNNLINGKII